MFHPQGLCALAVGAGGKRGPSTGVRASAKRRRAPLVLSPVQVKLGLAELEFRDQTECSGQTGRSHFAGAFVIRENRGNDRTL